MEQRVVALQHEPDLDVFRSALLSPRSLRGGHARAMMRDVRWHRGGIYKTIRMHYIDRTTDLN
jgi:hypothetical protein